MSARSLDQRVLFQRRSAARNSLNESVGWDDLVSCWAGIESAPEGERQTEPGERSALRYEVEVRSDIIERYGITLADRLLWDGVPLDIKDMGRQPRGQFATLIAVTGLSDG